VIPVIFGLLADRIGLQRAFVLPALCYLYVVFYGLRGSRHTETPAADAHSP
jgi:FHS family L-fucose permease-like MFS transporter